MEIKRALQRITFLDQIYTKWKWRERRVSYGEEYPDKTFYVIRRAYCKVGLFSYVMTNMGLADYALKNGYIPVIDMQNGRNTYLDDCMVGKENAWEYYFRQPAGYTLEDIRKARNVILSNGLITKDNEYPDFEIVEDEERFQYWHRFFKKNLQVAEGVQREFEVLRKQLFGEEKVLGILARGTDYAASKPQGHPIQPTTGQIIKKAEEVIGKYQCEKVYLATEDIQIYETLKKAFGKRMVAMNTDRYATSGNENINDLRKNSDKYQKGKEYLLSILLLTVCDCLVAGNVGGTHGAMLMSSGFEYQYIFRLGKYGQEQENDT